MLSTAELTPVYLLKVTGSFMGISKKGIPLGIWNSTAGEPQPGHKARINYELNTMQKMQTMQNTAKQN